MKIKKIFNWMDKKELPISCIVYLIKSIIFLFLFVTIIVLQTNKVMTDTTLRDKDAQIDKLLDANNSLVEKLINMEERDRQVFNYVKDYVLQINRTVPPLVATEIAKNVIIASDKYNLPVSTIVAVIERESHFNPTLCSKAGARGLMQVMPIWVKEKELNVNSRFDFHSIEKGINSGTYVLRKYLENNNNNMEKALLQYVNYDTQYVKDVYNSMGKFVIFKGLFESNRREEVLALEQEEQVEQVENEESKPKAFTYTVIEGDMFSTIAEKYTGNKLDWKKIHELNPNIAPEKIQIGIKLILPVEWNKTLKL